MSAVSSSRYRRQRGVTSIFVVVFAALLLSVITISFAYLMNREAQRSSDDELSQSAYDSAIAGVEDAKRVIMLANSGTPGSAAAKKAIDDGNCNTVAAAGVAGDPDDPEVMVQSTLGEGGTGESLNQAYTCVIITMNSDDFVSNIDSQMGSAFVPLTAEEEFNKVRIEWHPTQTSPTIQDACAVADPVSMPLCPTDNWLAGGDNTAVPALMRAQLITPGDEVTYDELDSSEGGTTVFLYPKPLNDDIASFGTAIDMDQFDRFVNSTGSGIDNRPQLVECNHQLSEDFSPTYRCRATLELSDAIEPNSTLSLLRLTAIYNATSFSVTLYNDDDLVRFAGVQPVVDSTGRANDLFRRVEARLSLVSQTTYPEFAVDVEGGICKDFYVTHDYSAQAPGATCSP